MFLFDGNVYVLAPRLREKEAALMKDGCMCVRICVCVFNAV